MVEESAINPEYASLFNDVESNRDHIFLLVSEILRGEISKYPIFIARKGPITLGKPFMSKQSHDIEWTINISLLEELAALGIVEPKGLEEFKKIYKDPQFYFCFLVIADEKQEFIFLPRTRQALN